MAKKDDIIKAKEEIIEIVKDESQEIERHLGNQIKELHANLARFLPYKRTFKASIYFFVLFLGSIFTDYLLDVKIIQPFWSWIGITISTGFLFMSYIMYSEWKKKIEE